MSYLGLVNYKLYKFQTMPTQYTRGTLNSSDYYEGISIGDTTALLETIRDEQGLAGQTVHLDEISTNKKLIMKGSDNGDDCYVIYETEQLSGVQHKLKIRGDHDGTETTVSPDVELEFLTDGQARLWMTTDESAGCIFVYNPAAFSHSAHFGFLEDRDEDDPFAWMVGRLDVWVTGAYHAKGAINRTNWHENKVYWYSSSESDTSPKGGYDFLWDYLTTCLTGTTTSTGVSTYAYRQWLGSLDRKRNKPVMGMYGYKEGPGVYNTWNTTATDRGTSCHFPGAVKFARTGLALIDPAVQPKIGTGTKRAISSGGKSQFQGFQIAA